VEKVLQALAKFSTSTISDAMDKLGIECACLGIKPVDIGFKMIGRAFTIKYGPIGTEGGTVGDYIDEVKPGEIVVLDNGGRLDCTVWGDILTSYSQQHGIAGTLIYGVCRDTNRSLELNYPIFSAGRYMRTGKDRVRVEGINVPVSVAHILVRPGDIILGDADGVVVVPKEYEERILQTAQQIETAEEEIRKAIDGGMRLVDARAKYKYHNLQHK
jgi:Demethylmenaquinone methyltransferase